jgi:hypothetical protein
VSSGWAVLKSFTVTNTLDYQGPQSLTFRAGQKFDLVFGSKEDNSPCLFNCSENKKYIIYQTAKSQAGEISFKVEFAKTADIDNEPYSEQKVEEGSEGECHLNINKK